MPTKEPLRGTVQKPYHSILSLPTNTRSLLFQDVLNGSITKPACILNDTRIYTDPCSLVLNSSEEIKMYPLTYFGTYTF